LDHPLTILPDQAIDIVAIEKKVMVGRTARSAYWLNHDPSGRSQNWLKRRLAMTAAIVRLLPGDEHALLKAYVEGTSEPANAAAIYDTLEVPAGATPPRLAIAVPQILLNHVQGTLPQWASVSGATVNCPASALVRQN
jgi:hypothetical protein